MQVVHNWNSVNNSEQFKAGAIQSNYSRKASFLLSLSEVWVLFADPLHALVNGCYNNNNNK